MVLKDIEGLVSRGYISKRKHPSEELFILNYTAKTQYEGLWNETTLNCRGLIVDSSGSIRARCFNKFFNYEEVRSEVDARLSSSLAFTVHEKVDGSLGILYWVGDEPFIATRGSFDSPQAAKANEMLRSRPRSGLDRNLTYLFEIVYPSNRICVDYGDMEDLVLLSAFHTESGKEVDPDTDSFPRAGKVDCDPCDLSALASMNVPNREGFVVRFHDGYRFKIKFEDYVRLHALIFSVSTKSIWKCLKDGGKLPLDVFPDEVYAWVREESAKIVADYESLTREAEETFSKMRDLPRKEFAAEALKYRSRPILFSMLDGRPVDQIAWKMVEPEHRTPFHEKIRAET